MITIFEITYVSSNIGPLKSNLDETNLCKFEDRAPKVEFRWKSRHRIQEKIRHIRYYMVLNYRNFEYRCLEIEFGDQIAIFDIVWCA